MSKVKSPSKSEPKKVAGSSGRARRLARHLRNHPNDKQSEANFKPDRQKKAPDVKLGWAHATFRGLSAEKRGEIRGKAQTFAAAFARKLDKKITGLLASESKELRANRSAEQEKLKAAKAAKAAEQEKLLKAAKPAKRIAKPSKKA